MALVNAYERTVGGGEMKPVCWIRQDGVIAFHEQKEVDNQGYKWNPLYTLRELSNEEISEFIRQMILCCQVHPNSSDINVLGLSRIVENIIKCASGNILIDNEVKD